MHRRSAPQSSFRLALSATAALAAAMLTTAGTPALAAGPATEASSACAGRYHDALLSVRGGVYQTIKAARPDTRKADDRLPGALLFTPPFRQRSSEERQALVEANRLAKSRGRPIWSASGDDRWIVDRIAGELGDYLSQDETPYLCGGVSGYLSTLRAYLTRVGGSPDRTGALVAAQRAAAEASIRAAMDAMRPVPVPEFAPSVRPADDPLSGLRPSKEIGRSGAALAGNAEQPDTASAARTASADRTSPGVLRARSPMPAARPGCRRSLRRSRSNSTATRTGSRRWTGSSGRLKRRVFWIPRQLARQRAAMRPARQRKPVEPDPKRRVTRTPRRARS